MTLPSIDIVWYVAGTSAAAGVVWLLSGWRRMAMVLTTIGLLGATLAAMLLATQGTVVIADQQLVHSPYARLWLGAAAATLLGLHLVGVASGQRPGHGPLALAALTATGAALTVDAPLPALLVLSAVTFAAAAPGTSPSQLRATTLTAVLALVASGVAITVVTPGHILFGASHAVGAALLLAAAAVVVRSGAVLLSVPRRSLGSIPAHRSSAAGRAWLPAATMLVLLAVTGDLLQPTGGDLEPVTVIIRAAGLAALAVPCLVALVARDVRLLVGATVTVNAALVMFALVPDVLIDPARGPRAAAQWLPYLGMVGTWAVAWLVALGGGGAVLSLRSARGWGRRRPILLAGLVVGGALSYGWPGTLPWHARAELLDLGLPIGTFRDVAGLLAWLPSVGLLRLLLAGLRRPILGGHDMATPVLQRDWPLLATRSGWARWSIRGVPMASLLVVVLAFAPAMLGPGLGDLEALAGTASGIRAAPSTLAPSPGPRIGAGSVPYSAGASTHRSTSRP